MTALAALSEPSRSTEAVDAGRLCQLRRGRVAPIVSALNAAETALLELLPSLVSGIMPRWRPDERSSVEANDDSVAHESGDVRDDIASCGLVTS